MHRYKNRQDAGRRLAAELNAYRLQEDVLVLGLPRGGVPVAEQVALALGAPLEVFIVRKVGVPGHAELAMGAIASGGLQVVNEGVKQSAGVSDEEFSRAADAEAVILRAREQAFRSGREEYDPSGKIVILVDDGIATGATMRVAVKALRQGAPKKLVIAVPVASPEACRELATMVDELVCPLQPPNFGAVGLWYENFGQTGDDEVQAILEKY